ncbi:hypothetical protein HDZ31DRAFT_32926 [Schizophyllum fasciatum]
MPHLAPFSTFAHKRSPGTAAGGWNLQPLETAQPEDPMPTSKHIAAPNESGPSISYDASIGIAIGCIAGGFVLLYVVCKLWQRRARRRSRRHQRLRPMTTSPVKPKLVFPYKTLPESSFNRPTPAVRHPPSSLLPWKVHSSEPKSIDKRISFVGRAANRLSTMVSSARKSKLWAPAPAATTQSRISALYRPSARYADPAFCPKTAACWILADDVVGAHPAAIRLEHRTRERCGPSQPIMFRWAENPFDGDIVPKLKTDAINALDRLVVGSEQEAKYPTLARSGSGPKIMITQPSSDVVSVPSRAGQHTVDERVLVQTPSLQSNERVPLAARPCNVQVLQPRVLNKQGSLASLNNVGGRGMGERRAYVNTAQKENVMSG